MQSEVELSNFKRELVELQNQLADQDEMHKETIKKYQNSLAMITVHEATIEAQLQEIDELLKEKANVIAQFDELKSQLNTTSIDLVSNLFLYDLNGVFL